MPHNSIRLVLQRYPVVFDCIILGRMLPLEGRIIVFPTRCMILDEWAELSEKPSHPTALDITSGR